MYRHDELPAHNLTALILRHRSSALHGPDLRMGLLRLLPLLEQRHPTHLASRYVRVNCAHFVLLSTAGLPLA
jgi:hypothetical protein